MVGKQIFSWQIPQAVPNQPAELTPGTPVDLAIEFDGHGYRLLATEIGGDFALSQWYPSLKAAEQQAAQLFGPKTRDWETVGMP